MPILSLGVSYRHASVELLERLTFADEAYPKAYQRLGQLDAVMEGVILSTCNRVEVYAEVPLYHQGFQDLKRFISESREVPFEEFAEPLYSHYEDEAAEHLFAVASGLDSMVLGEPQILSQVRAAIRRAREEQVAGPALGALFDQAVRVGRRVRAETAVGASPGAFVEAGAELAERHLGGLTGRAAAVVGTGTMSALSVRALLERGVAPITVIGRRPARAAKLAATTGTLSGTFEELREAVAGADLVVSATAATGVVVSREIVEARADASRPLFLLDLAVPRDIDPAAADLPGARLCDIDDLREAVASGREDVAAEVERARAIVAEETGRSSARRREARLAPVIEALHARGEDVRAAELERMASRLAGLSERERAAVETLSRRIVRRLLHDPVVRLKDLTGRGVDERHAQALAELFGLDLPDR